MLPPLLLPQLAQTCSTTITELAAGAGSLFGPGFQVKVAVMAPLQLMETVLGPKNWWL